MNDDRLIKILPTITQLRQDLHRYAELSGKEEITARHLKAYFQKSMPDQLLTRLGSGTGLAAVYNGTEAGPTLLFRADMDALPIPETITSDYASQQDGVSHKCGHDGHMAMVAGLAPLLASKPPKRGKVVLFMQPAEETGMGAKALLEDPQFRALAPDYIFGLHNLPGYPLGQLVLREGTFCAASRGLRVVLSGRTSHAAEPALGVSPAAALAQLLLSLPAIPQQLSCQELVLLTLTHAQLGEATFGTSPGQALLQVTLRANLDDEMELLVKAVEEHILKTAREHALQVSLSYHEVFPVTQNSPQAAEILLKAAKETELDIHLKEEPFRWSEDFGHYNSLATAGFFGIGAGEALPNLHNPTYDFPDALLPYGLKMYWSLVESLTGRE